MSVGGGLTRRGLPRPHSPLGRKQAGLSRLWAQPGGPLPASPGGWGGTNHLPLPAPKEGAHTPPATVPALPTSGRPTGPALSHPGQAARQHRAAPASSARRGRGSPAQRAGVGGKGQVSSVSSTAPWRAAHSGCTHTHVHARLPHASSALLLPRPGVTAGRGSTGDPSEGVPHSKRP